MWQDGYYERVLRHEDHVFPVIDYILNNPVRAKLSEKPEKYPYSWSIKSLRMDEESVSMRITRS